MSTNTGNILLAFSLFIIIVLNVTTASRYPETWTDEVMYIDSAINLVEGNGFTSSAWPSQSKDEFWSSNSPLYSLLEAGWIKIFGSGVNTTRILSYIFGIISVFLISIGLKNFNLVRSKTLRNTSMVFLLMLFPIVYAYRIGRPDIVCLLLSSSTFAAASFQSSRLRDTLLVFSAMLTPFANLSVVFFILTVICIGFLFFRRKILRDAVLISVGIGLGVVLLLGFYWFNDSLNRFLMITVGSGHTLLGQMAQYIIFDDNRVIEKFKAFPSGYLQSISNWPYTTLLLIFSYLLLLLPKVNRNKINYFFIVSIFSVPLILLSIGEYTWLMSWMHISLLTIAIFYSIDHLDWRNNSKILRSSLVPLFLCASIGFPWTICIALSEWDQRSREPIEDFAEKHITSDDIVVIDPFVYFEAKKRAKGVFSTSYGGGQGLREIPEEQKQSISKMIIEEDDFIEMQSKYDGQWKITGQFYLDLRDYGIFNYRFKDFRTWDTLLVYEREQ